MVWTGVIMRAEKQAWAAAFEEHFWPMYRPLRGGLPNPKGRALRAWLKVANPTQEAFDQVIAELEFCIKAWRAEGTEAQYVPHAATWLNARIVRGRFVPQDWEMQ